MNKCISLLVTLCTLIASSLTGATSDNTNERRSHKKPNILLILADDVGTGDLPYYWKSSGVAMPNIGRLTEMGVTFMDAHSTPVCAPSRYMLLSGNYAHRGNIPAGSWGLSDENKNQFLPGQTSIAQVLRDDAGYSTAMFGKWHMGAGVHREEGYAFNRTHVLTDPRHDWSRQIIDGPQDIGFDTSLITSEGIQKSPYAFFRNGYLSIDPSEAKYWKSGEYRMTHGISKIRDKEKFEGEGAADWDSSAYNMILVNETMKFIQDHIDSDSADDNPFFAYVALGAVHTPYSPPDRYLDGEDIANVHETEHMDMLYEVDKVVGSLVSIIEDNNLADDTIIIFTSDNGGGKGTDPSTGHHSNGPLRGHKGLIYEGGHRIPLIVRYDNDQYGFPAGEERKHIIGLNDVYATLCDLVGVDVPYPSAQDSVSFADYLSSEDNQEGLREELATFSFQKGPVPFHSHSIRFGKYKLIHNRADSLFELYDLDADLYETNNLYEEGRNEQYAQMMGLMYTRLIETGPCPVDREGSFVLSGGAEEGESVTCDWFRRSTRRCNENFEGRLHCNSICGSPTNMGLCGGIVFPPIPTSDGNGSCNDSNEIFQATFPRGDNKMKSCSWSRRNNASWRCKYVVGVKEACPLTCTNCCRDVTGFFKLLHKNKKSVSCSWVGKNKKKRCMKAPSRQLCALTCGEC